MKLTDYMRKTEKIYKELAPRYLEAAKQDEENRQAILNVRNSRDLTYEGKQKKIAALQEKGKAFKAEMAAIAATANEQAQEVRQEVAERFYGFYHATPQAIDMQGLELLKSGILSESELMQVAEGYKGNATMQRICGKYMQQSDSRTLREMGSVLQANASNPHLKCIDSIIEVGTHCMGGAPLSGANGAEHMFARFDEMTAQTYAAAPDIEA